MLDKANQEHFQYTQIGEGGHFTVLVLDSKRDGGRYVPLMYFDIKSHKFMSAGVRWLDP